MKKIILVPLALLISIASLKAQNDGDVLRYSANYYYGTARFNGLGGAFGALGGDLSSFNTNPAGIGVFRSGEISVTPALEVNNLSTRWNGSAFEDSKPKLVINNAGIVFNSVPKNPNWKAVNFGFGYNRLNSFNDDLTVSGEIPFNQSNLYDFAWDAEGYTEDALYENQAFGSALAYDAYVLDPIDTNSTNTSYVPSGNYQSDVVQSHTTQRNGRSGETNFAVAANYKDRFYFGATLAFQNVRYDVESRTTETIVNTNETELDEYTFSQFLETTGWGVNGKVGVIFRANEWLRLGAAAHTPTVLQLTDVYSNRIVSHFDNGDEITSNSPEGVYDYRIVTPARFQVSSAVLFGSKGLLSFQYEFSDMSQGELKTVRNSGESTQAVFGDANQAVNNYFTLMNTFRVGGEIRLNQYFTARAGAAYFTSPYTADAFDGDFGQRLQVGGGLGFRSRNFYIDATYQRTNYEETYLINPSGANANITNNLSTLSLTLGFKM